MTLATLTDLQRKTLLRVIVALLDLDYDKTTSLEVARTLMYLKEAAGGRES